MWLKILQILLTIELTFFTSHLKPSSVWPRSSSLTSPPPSLFHLLSSVTIQKEWIPPPCRQLCCFRPVDLPPPFTFPHSLTPAAIEAAAQLLACVRCPSPFLPQWPEHSSGIYASVLLGRFKDSLEQRHRIFIFPSPALVQYLAHKSHSAKVC